MVNKDFYLLKQLQTHLLHMKIIKCPLTLCCGLCSYSKSRCQFPAFFTEALYNYFGECSLLYIDHISPQLKGEQLPTAVLGETDRRISCARVIFKSQQDGCTHNSIDKQHKHLFASLYNKKLSCRRETARCFLFVCSKLQHTYSAVFIISYCGFRFTSA